MIRFAAYESGYILLQSNRAHKVEIGADQFKIHCIEVALGGGRVGLSACEPSSIVLLRGRLTILC